MRILFISNTGEALSIATRLKKEGHAVTVYIHNPAFRANHDGLIAKLTMRQVRSQAENSDLVIFDMNKPAEGKHDRALQKTFGVSGDGLFGPIADALRDGGIKVVGCSAETERIELDRRRGSGVAKRAGLSMPKSFAFSSLAQGVSFLRGNAGTCWAFKPSDNQDLDLTYVEQYPEELIHKLTVQYPKRLKTGSEFILQEVIDGVEISTEAWWTGKTWTCFNHTIEDKQLMAGGYGPRVGSMNNTVWLKRKKRGLLVDMFGKLTPFIKKSGYIGPVDVNCIVSRKDKKPYFLEWTPRLGYDAIYCLLSLVRGPLGNFFDYVSGGSKKPRFAAGYASSVRLTIPPYPYEVPKLLDGMARDVEVSGDLDDLWMEDVYYQDGIRCAGADGVIGVLTGTWSTLGGSVKNVYKKAEKIKIGAYTQTRTDLGERAKAAIATLDRWGVTVD